MEDEFYIIIELKFFDVGETNKKFYHIERIFSNEQLQELVEKEINYEVNDDDWYDEQSYENKLIVTNNAVFLNKYKRALNEDMLEKLCSGNTNITNNVILRNYYSLILDMSSNNKKKIINDFIRIKNSEIISSSEMYYYESYKEGEYYWSDYNSLGWQDNAYFKYLNTPYRYKKTKNNFEKFNIPFWGKIKVENFIKNINFDFLQFCNKGDLHITKNNVIRIYDNISACRIYLSKDILYILNTFDDYAYEQFIQVETKLDKNLYIEYFITRVYADPPYYDDLTEDNQQEKPNWLSEASGTDDPETMNDVYWNLD